MSPINHLRERQTDRRVNIFAGLIVVGGLLGVLGLVLWMKR